MVLIYGQCFENKKPDVQNELNYSVLKFISLLCEMKLRKEREKDVPLTSVKEKNIDCFNVIT